MKSYETQHFKVPKEFIAIIVGTAAVVGAGQYAHQHLRVDNTEQNYAQHYTATGQCLSDSAYSPSAGAELSLTQDPNRFNYYLEVTPSQSLHLPALLFALSNGHLIAANKTTAQTLTANDCKPVN